MADMTGQGAVSDLGASKLHNKTSYGLQLKELVVGMGCSKRP